MLRIKTSKSSRSRPKRAKKLTVMSLNDNSLVPYKQKIEYKYTDTTVTQFATVNGQLSGLDYPPNGTGPSERIGNEITVKSVEVRYHAALNGSTASAVRLMLLVDLQGYNSPAVTDILAPANVGSVFCPISTFNYVYRKRFRILWETLFTIYTAYPEHVGRIKLPVSLTSAFVGASTFVNQMYWLVCSDESNPTNYPVVNACLRVLYSD